MRRFGAFAAILLTTAGTAHARSGCTLDLLALVSVHSRVTVQEEPDNAPWPLPVLTTSDLLVSVGGAATLMRTDDDSETPATRTFLSGRLPNQRLKKVQGAVVGLPVGPLPDCWVPSDPEPPGIDYTRGFRSISLYTPFAVTTFRIQHASPSETLLPRCEPPVEALEQALMAAEEAVVNGELRPLQCKAR
jgi:hypothetical protein